MTKPIAKFTQRMRLKLEEVEQRLDGLKTATEKQSNHAAKAIRQHVASLEDDTHQAKDKLKQARADLASWVEDTKEAVAGWKAKLDITMLHARADRTERHAEAAMTVALASIDHAEKAMLVASIARHEADQPQAA